MSVQFRKYPIGQSSFKEVVEGGSMYVDKTAHIYDITHRFKFVFLSRPRRFGKSLFVDTLQCYFEARKELFEGLNLASLETEWIKYPVLRFDMSSLKNKDIAELKDTLNGMLCDYEKIYGAPSYNTSFGARLEFLIKSAHAKTGQKVVLLIDEYDSPMLEVFHDKEKLSEVRDILRNFYGPIKICDSSLRFGFLTGITKFSQMGIFSGINNLMDISMLDEYCDICGISKEELTEQCRPDIEATASAMGCSYEDMVQKLTLNYDGYHFSDNSKDIFNPFSLIKAFSSKKLGYYWFESATPTFLFGLMKNSAVNVTEMDGFELRLSSFNVSPERDDIDVAIPFLYQAGYLTIRNYDKSLNIYRLGFPNNEVRYGFLNEFMPSVTGLKGVERDVVIIEIARALYRGDIDSVMKRLQTMLARMSYFYGGDHEVDFQSAMYVVFTMLTEQYVKAETPFALGRPDAVIETPEYVYIMEYKIDQNPDAALAQIEERHYAASYISDSRKLLKVGINFSTKQRNIDAWKVV